jgi:hypothetical protein
MAHINEVEKRGGGDTLFRSAACRFGRYVILSIGILILLFAGEKLADGSIKDATVGIVVGILTLGICLLFWYAHLCVSKWCGHNY